MVDISRHGPGITVGGCGVLVMSATVCSEFAMVPWFRRRVDVGEHYLGNWSGIIRIHLRGEKKDRIPHFGFLSGFFARFFCGLYYRCFVYSVDYCKSRVVFKYSVWNMEYGMYQYGISSIN
jgi:hypothetical protein